MDRGGFVAASVSFLNEWWKETQDVHFCSLPTDFVDLSVEDGRGEAKVVLVCARIAALVMGSRLFRLGCLREATAFGQIGRGRFMPQSDFGTSGSRLLQIHSCRLPKVRTPRQSPTAK